MIARHLGVSEYGILSFAISLVSFFLILSNLGLQDVLVKHLVTFSEDSNALLGTGFALISTVSLCCFAINLAIASQLSTFELRLIVSIVGISILFNGYLIFELYFLALIAGRRIAIAKGISLIISVSIKLLLIYFHAPMEAFAWSIALDSVVLLLSFAITFRLHRPLLRRWSVSLSHAKLLLRESWPLLMSGLFITIYMKIDQIMLLHFLGAESVGYYSVAVQISQAWYFVPMLISAAYFPIILEKRKNRSAFDSQLLTLYRTVCLIGLTVAVLVTIYSSDLIVTLFTEEYAPAAPVLTIHIWAGVFVGIGTVSGKWLVSESLTKHALYRTGLGAIVNIVLNIMLIPPAGIIGAAVATIIAQIVSTYFYDLLHAETRHAFRTKTKALLLPLPIKRFS